jgi:putative transcriptional regulator
VKTTKTLGARIVGGLEEAVAFERGLLPGVRVRRVPLTARTARVRPAPAYDAPRIVALRARLRLSQPVFAQALNVSADTVRAWEQGKRRPDGAALRLLQVAERHPQAIVEHVRRRSA